MRLPLGCIVAEGKSRFDNSALVAVATGLRIRSNNRKTGPVIQIYVLQKDVVPSSALSTGEDRSICGNCIHRKLALGSCYVDVVRGADQVWKSLKSGNYSPLNNDVFDALPNACFRLTAYGDCAALPFDAWEKFLSLISKTKCTVLGYTHQWAKCEKEFQNFCMASVESTEEQRRASALGWRTFRIRLPGSPMTVNEVQCPADTHADVKTLCGVDKGSVTCDTCRQCDGGKSGNNISLYPHGINYRQRALTNWLEKSNR